MRAGRIGAAAAAALIALGMAGAALAYALPESNRLFFSVVRNGDSPMGHHRLSFTRDGDTVTMDMDIRFEVKIAFVTAYRYQHTNREVWKAGRLQSLETTTNDDGDRYWVRGAATEAGFAVESSTGSFTAPADIVPTSYWNDAILTATQLLDTQRGLLMDVRIDAKGEEEIVAAGKTVRARHHTINILTNKPGATDRIEAWYDAEGRWVKMSYKAKGQDIEYTLDPPPVPPQQAERAP
ncbi:MAG TPA: DUF6134 family protein [Azospirillaceae bacterium]|nr:DUF6134 family protein [Azospirillaceae bacterium]